MNNEDHIYYPPKYIPVLPKIKPREIDVRKLINDLINIGNRKQGEPEVIYVDKIEPNNNNDTPNNDKNETSLLTVLRNIQFIFRLIEYMENNKDDFNEIDFVALKSVKREFISRMEITRRELFKLNPQKKCDDPIPVLRKINDEFILGNMFNDVFQPLDIFENIKITVDLDMIMFPLKQNKVTEDTVDIPVADDLFQRQNNKIRLARENITITLKKYAEDKSNYKLLRDAKGALKYAEFEKQRIKEKLELEDDLKLSNLEASVIDLAQQTTNISTSVEEINDFISEAEHDELEAQKLIEAAQKAVEKSKLSKLKAENALKSSKGKNEQTMSETNTLHKVLNNLTENQRDGEYKEVTNDTTTISSALNDIAKKLKILSNDTTIPQALETKKTYEYTDDFLASDQHLISPNFELFKYTTVVENSSLVSPFPEGNWKTLIQKSAAGSGKTKSCVEFCKKNVEHSQLIITPLRVLAVNHQEAFHELHFLNYMEFLGGDRKIFEDADKDKWIIGELSLHVIPEGRIFDIIIIDEVEQVESQFMSPFQLKHPKWHDSLSRLEFLMKHAKQVVLMDAAITYRTILFAGIFRPCKILPNTPDYDQDILIRINKTEPEIRYVTLGDHGGDLKNIQKLLFEKLDAGMRIALTSGSKEFASQCGKLAKIKGIKYAIHTRDEPNISLIKDVNKHWSQCQLVILSPNITTAVSYTSTPFNELISLICLNSATIRDQFQMTKRFRALTTQHITVYFNAIRSKK